MNSESRGDNEKLLDELIKRRSIGRESRKDKTLLNYLSNQRYDEVFAETDKGKSKRDLR